MARQSQQTLSEHCHALPTKAPSAGGHLTLQTCKQTRRMERARPRSTPVCTTRRNGGYPAPHARALSLQGSRGDRLQHGSHVCLCLLVRSSNCMIPFANVIEGGGQLGGESSTSSAPPTRVRATQPSGMSAGWCTGRPCQCSTATFSGLRQVSCTRAITDTPIARTRRWGWQTVVTPARRDSRSASRQGDVSTKETSAQWANGAGQTHADRRTPPQAKVG